MYLCVEPQGGWGAPHGTSEYLHTCREEQCVLGIEQKSLRPMISNQIIITFRVYILEPSVLTFLQSDYPNFQTRIHGVQKPSPPPPTYALQNIEKSDQFEIVETDNPLEIEFARLKCGPSNILGVGRLNSSSL